MMIKRVPFAVGGLLASLAVGCVAVTDGTGAEVLGAGTDGLRCLDAGTRFYVPAANPGVKEQIKALKAAHQRHDAALIKALSETPHAVWLTGGTPKSVKKEVKKVMERAGDQHAVPVQIGRA